MKLSIALSAALALASISAEAATKTWSGTGGDKLFSNANNWVGGAAPEEGDAIQIHSAANNGGANTNDLAAGFRVGGIVFSGTGSSSIGTFGAATGGGSLKLDGDITRDASASSSIGSVIELLRDVNIAVEGTRNLALYNSAVSGSFGITKTGAGALTMRGNSTFTGDLIVNAGSLITATAADNMYHFGMGTVRLNNDASIKLNGAQTTVAGLAGTAGTLIENGNAGTNRSFTVNSSDTVGTTFAGTIQNGGAATLVFNKQGIGKLTLTGTNAYTGATSVTGGTLLVSDGGSLTGSAVNVGAAGTFGGNGGTVTNAVTVADGGSLAFTLSDKNQTNLTLLSSLTLSGNNDLSLTLNTGVSEGDSFTLLLITENLDVSSKFSTINGAAFAPDNTFTLNYGGLDYGFQLLYGANSVSVVSTSAIPEPSVGLLLGAASFGAVWLRGRARRRQSLNA